MFQCVQVSALAFYYCLWEALGYIGDYKKESSSSLEKNSSNKMVAYCYNRNYLIVKDLLEQARFIVQKSSKRPSITTMKVESLVKEAMEQFIKEYYQITQ